MAVNTFAKTVIGLAIGLFVFFILYGAFGSTILDNLDTIATHPNMTTDGATAIENSNTMYALIGFAVLVVVIVALFLEITKGK